MSNPEQQPLRGSYPPPYYSQPQPYPGQPAYAQAVPAYRPELNYAAGTQQVYCPFCRRMQWTRVKKRPGILAFLSCTLLCLLGCWLCCFIPFCISSCYDAYHYCSVCNTPLGVVTSL
mmetsp:Transcript_11341/g.16766  ORF Transcript_11341/g.16766 Transcript_11341/m.16766 type:complete len:117 (+) Transcript_11341:267-617(+)